MDGIGNLFTYNAFVNFWCVHLTYVAIFLVLSLSLNLINGYTGLFSLGHHGFWAVGAYAGAVLLVVLRPAGEASIARDAGLLVVAMIGGGLAAALAGLLIGIPCLRLRGDYLAIATLAFGEIIRVVITNIEAIGGAKGYDVPYLFGLSLETTKILYLIVSWIIALLVLLVINNLVNSYHGRALRSISQDEVAAQLLGVNVAYYKVAAFAIGAAFAGVAGVLFAAYNQYIAPSEFGFMKGVTILLMVVLGGLGSLRGTIIATFVLYMIPVLLTLGSMAAGDSVGGRALGFVNAWYMVFYSLLLIVLMVTRPQGLTGKKGVAPKG